nr:unnamed protein product [Callosobruchus chinensis]
MDDSESEQEPFSGCESEYEPGSDESEESTSLSDNSSYLQPQKSKRLGRKRFREPAKHIKCIRKKRRNQGLEYIGTQGKVVPAKAFTNLDCKCRMRCFSRIKGQRRKFAFECFWKMGDFSTQNAYICGLVKQTFIVRRRPRSGNRCEKTTTNTYYVNAENTSEKVCKTYFLQTFQISNGRLGRALKRARVSSPGEDLRGRHEPANKTPEAKIQMVWDHINSFPSYQSHYTRSHNSNRKYLDSKLNLRLMYGLYKEKYGNNGDAPVSEAIYRHVFHHDFNLHFHVPSKDTCVRCDLFKAKLNCATDDNVKKTINQEHTLHLRKSEKARQSLIDDKSACILNRGEVYGFTFDLEKALPFPTLTCSLAYYKRNMYVYNLGIHELGEDEKGFMYVWNETIASRGAQEIGSLPHTLKALVK